MIWLLPSLAYATLVVQVSGAEGPLTVHLGEQAAPLRDDGQPPDVFAGDGRFSAVVEQPDRRVVVVLERPEGPLDFGEQSLAPPVEQLLLDAATGTAFAGVPTHARVPQPVAPLASWLLVGLGGLAVGIGLLGTRSR